MPPANQIILIKASGIPPVFDFLKPLKVTGVIEGSLGRREVFLFDGVAMVDHSYGIKGAKILPAEFSGASIPLEKRIAWPALRRTGSRTFEE